MTKIEWTERTWNPIAGCSLASPGCAHCYAMRMAARLEAMGIVHYRGLTQPSKAGAVWTGKVALAPDSVLFEPLRWKKPTTWFVNSMSDLFHEAIPDEWIDPVFAVMALTPHHTYQILTKRLARMRAYIDKARARVAENAARTSPIGRGFHHLGVTLSKDGFDMNLWPLPNVWLGISCEDQKRADERIRDLLATPAAVRFLSCEPLLGPLDLEHIPMSEPDERSIFRTLNALTGRRGHGGKCGYTETCDPIQPHLDWVICGGESGHGARSMHPAWARVLRDQCIAADIPFFFKQWGEFAPYNRSCVDGASLATPYSLDLPMQRFGKKAAGCLLDGKEWKQVPQRKTA